MCDQIPVDVCKQLSPDELMSMELLQCQRREVDAHSTLLEFLLDTFHGNHPFATIDDRLTIGMALLRIVWEIDDDFAADIPKLTSKDVIRLGYGCAHVAA